MKGDGMAAVFCAVIATSLSPSAAQMIDVRWEVLAPDEKAIIDRIAADFYEASLRKSQSYAIEAKTSERYAEADASERERFRDERRRTWEAMNAGDRQSLRSAKVPAFSNLAEAQKTPFRSIALDKLSAAGAIDQDALADALRDDI